MGTTLWLVDKHNKGFSIQQPKTRLGRDNQNQIVIQDAQVSRLHATIIVRGSRVYIQDERIRNGTWVSGARISGAIVAARETDSLSGATLAQGANNDG